MSAKIVLFSGIAKYFAKKVDGINLLRRFFAKNHLKRWYAYHLFK